MKRNPYKLFDYYTYEDRDFFFGREQESQRMVGEILSTRLLVLFSPSGSGKSSLLNAGVRPILESRGYRTLYVRLETNPSDSILSNLQNFPELDTAKEKLDLHAALRRICPAPANATLAAGRKAPELNDGSAATSPPLVIFLDQFEEFFIAFQKEPKIRFRFIEELADIIYDRTIRAYFVLSLRDDYFVRLVEFRETIPSIFQNNANVELRPFEDDAALSAIVKPAEATEVEFAEGLPDRIIRDLKSLNTRGDGVLPITLQMVCYTLWERREDNCISTKTYDATGGSAKLIQAFLNKALGAIPKRQRPLMRRLFYTLSNVDRTKRPRSFGDLLEILHAKNASRLKDLLHSLRDAQIIREEQTQGTTWYEFRHDYLAIRVADWLVEEEKRLSGIRTARLIFLALTMPVIFYFGWLFLEFNTYVIRFRPKGYQSQFNELTIVRKINPFGLQIDTGLAQGSLDRTNVEAENTMQKGLVLPFAKLRDWTPLLKQLSRESRARTELALAPNDADLSALDDLETADYARVDAKVLKRVFAALRGDKDLRLAAAKVLGHLNRTEPWVVGALLADEKDKDVHLRLAAAEALVEARRADSTVIETLMTEMKDEKNETEVRIAAAEALAELGNTDKTVILCLLAASVMSNEKRDNVDLQHAQEALVKLGRSHTQVAMILLMLLPHEEVDLDVRLTGLETIAKFGWVDMPVVNRLLEVLKDDRFEVRERSATADTLAGLRRTDSSVVDALSATVKEEKNELVLRLAAAEAMVKLGKADLVAGDLLFAVVRDNKKDFETRFVAAKALARLGRDDESVVEALLARFAASKAQNKSQDDEGAKQALLDLGRANTSIVEVLSKLMNNDVGDEIRAATVEIIGELGRPNTPTFASLIAILKNKNNDSDLRRDAAIALANINGADPLVRDIIMAVINDNDNSNRLRLTAAAALMDNNQSSPTLIDALLPFLKNDDARARMIAAELLAKLGRVDPPVVDVILASLKDNDTNLRRRAAGAIGDMGRPDQPLIDALLLNLEDADFDVRSAALRALIRLSEKENSWNEAFLIQKLQDNSNAWRIAAIYILANRSSLVPTSVDKIQTLRDDRRPWVKISALRALAEIAKHKIERESD